MRMTMNEEELRFAKAWELPVRGVERPLPSQRAESAVRAPARPTRAAEPQAGHAACLHPGASPSPTRATPSSSHARGSSPTPAPDTPVWIEALLDVIEGTFWLLSFLWRRLARPTLTVLGRMTLRGLKVLYRWAWACIVVAVLTRPTLAQQYKDTIPRLARSVPARDARLDTLERILGAADTNLEYRARAEHVDVWPASDNRTAGTPVSRAPVDTSPTAQPTRPRPLPVPVNLARQPPREARPREASSELYLILLVLLGGGLGCLGTLEWLQRRTKFGGDTAGGDVPDPQVKTERTAEVPMASASPRRDNGAEPIPWDRALRWRVRTPEEALLALQALDLGRAPSLTRGSVHRPATPWLLGAATRQGPRDSNQDLCLSFQVGSFSFGLLMDGAGGLPGGADAARIAGLSGALQLLTYLDRRGGEPPDYGLWARTAIEAARRSLVGLGSQLRLSTFADGYRTTMLVFVAGSERAGFAHIGDGGGVLVSSSGSVRPLFHPMRDGGGRLAASLGPSPHGGPVSCEFRRRPGDLVLLGCDGVFDVASSQMPCVLAQKAIEADGDLDRALHGLVDVFEASGAITDNLTLVAVGTGQPTAQGADYLVRLGRSCAAAPLPALTTNPGRTVEDHRPQERQDERPPLVGSLSFGGR